MPKTWKRFLKYLSGQREKCDPYRQLPAVYIVPPRTLLAYQYIDGQNIPIQDQTVWVIDKYEKGYFFGKAYVALNGQAKSELNLIGTVTPDGNVYLTFFQTTGNLKDTDPVRGIGSLTMVGKQGYFTMQMNSAENALTGLAHWSYMIPVKPDDYWYQHLPSLDISVPAFIRQFS